MSRFNNYFKEEYDRFQEPIAEGDEIITIEMTRQEAEELLHLCASVNENPAQLDEAVPLVAAGAAALRGLGTRLAPNLMSKAGMIPKGVGKPPVIGGKGGGTTIIPGMGGGKEKENGSGKSSTPSQPLTVTGPPKPKPTLRTQQSAAGVVPGGSQGVTPAR